MWLTSQEALRKLQLMGVGKKAADSLLSEDQFRNWIGSGKVWFEICEGQKKFDSGHIEEVGSRYIKSSGLAYSIYHFDKDSGRRLEYINSYQCGGMWSVSDRQAQNIIASGKPAAFGSPFSIVRKIGRENFVLREAAEDYANKRRVLV